MASSPRKKPPKEVSSGEGSDSDFVAESEEEEESVSEPSDSDYEPDEDFKPKRKATAASRSSGRRAAGGSYGTRRYYLKFKSSRMSKCYSLKIL